MSQIRQVGQQRDNQQTSIPQQVLECISYPFTACMPSSSSFRDANHDEQRQSLLRDTTYEDSDAISLLSNIADRSHRRNRASRRRERWNNSAAVLGCGLFGRPKGQIQARQQTTGDANRAERQATNHARSASVDSAASTDDESGRANSFAAAQESGDEDAGMLADEAIANLSVSRDEELEQQQGKDATDKTKKEEEEAVEVAKRKEELQRQVEETARIEAEDAAKRKAEEEALAAEEEAAIAKAKRRAERKAIKQGLLEAKAHGQRSARRMTEAEAEAAAGGFDFAEESQMQGGEDADYGSHYDQQRYHANQGEYGLAHGPEGYGYDEYEQQNQPEVVHHHHYYHEPEQEESEQPYTLSQPPITYVSEHNDGQKSEEAVDEDEEDADIAGIAFSKNRKKRLDRGGSYGSRSNGSGSGSRQSGSQPGRYERNGVRAGGSNSSAGRRESHDAGSSNGGGSSSGKFTYRDRPRRHERTGSRSAGSGNGRALREGPGGKVITSPTIPESDQSNDLSFATITQSDDRADAAAGGFDDFLSPPTSSNNTTWTSDWRQDSNDQSIHIGGGGQKPSLSPNSSTSGKAGRRREMPRKQFSGAQSGMGGLNAPRNPAVGNIFGQRQSDEDEDAHLEGL
ncbi:uncharacterized protein FA14DRAFT_160415 [Meira miltonrushii]|uniref:Uncharacterized protein n=1 Tax=Meira miltonrushii TaxID=1280837 RepID=A0A316VBT8_9BASI|nr:uncharacterized protein FA14DRAFT_160415 [Meira miltonrushii]PWN35127.1 hypothetical protein FA14DRAFT_160415 [Meira miltonrushii]